MDYKKHYETLIHRAQNRSILPDVYFEKHHIIPKCIGGTDDSENIVKLFPEEHYVAHQLLVKIYPNERSLVYAAHMMGNTRKGNKSYGWLRSKFAILRSGTPHSEETKRKISNIHRGRTGPKMPETTRRAIRNANIGKPSKLKGVSRSRESVEKMIISNKDRYESWKGKPMETVQCPHCHKVGNRIVMHRWHFNNCKFYS